MTPVAWFKDVGIADRPTVGGKGGSLGELTQAGIAVPPGFVVTTAAFELFLKALEARAPVRERVAALDPSDLGAATKLSEELRRRVIEEPMPAEVEQAIRAAQEKPARADLHLRARGGAQGWRVDLDALAQPGAGAAALYLALYEDGLSSQVRAGENAGSLLRHDRVVRGLWGPWPLGARQLDVRPPTGARPGALGFTAFVQDEAGRTLQALSLPLSVCSGK
jgi:hypothetical protein